MKRTTLAAAMGIGLLALAAGRARADDLVVTNVTVIARDHSTAYVKFDISWENSWRYTTVNHDAAWVFFKVQPDGQTDWKHVTLEGTGTNPTDYNIGTGTPIEMIVPSDRVGLFVRRSGEGAGTTIEGQFEVGTGGTPFAITNEKDQITLGGGGAGSLGNHNTTGMSVADDFNNTTSKILPSAFPKGYAAATGRVRARRRACRTAKQPNKLT